MYMYTYTDMHTYMGMYVYMYIYDFPGGEDLKREDGEKSIWGWEIAKVEAVYSRGQQVEFLSFIFKEVYDSLFCNLKRTVREEPGELPPHCSWIEIPRYSKVKCVCLSLSKEDSAEPFLNSLSSRERERGFPALLVTPSLCWNRLSSQACYSSRRLQVWVRKDLKSPFS